MRNSPATHLIPQLNLNGFITHTLNTSEEGSDGTRDLVHLRCVLSQACFSGSPNKRRITSVDRYMLIMLKRFGQPGYLRPSR